MRPSHSLRLLLAGALLAAPAQPAGSSAWESNSYADFVKGRFTGVSLTRDGRLTLAPRLDQIFASGEAGVWSAVAAPDGAIYLGTGHRGRVYRLRPNQQPEVYWNAPHPEVFALALDSKGVLYAATSPNGRVWRIEDGKAKEYFNPNSPYIWALAFAPSGELYAATGDQGKIYRITGENQGEIWYETGQTHVTSLAFDLNKRLLAGTEPNGILYRVEAKNRAFVLYDSSLPEIRSIVPAPDGSLYVAALGGSVAQKQAAGAAAAPAPGSPAGMVTTTITVTADDAAKTQGGVEIKPPAAAAKPPEAGAALPAAPSVYEMPGVERTAIYHVFPDNTAETLWSSKEENVFDIALRNGEIVFSTDQRGRIYRLAADLKATLLVETKESETTRLIPSGPALLAATANLGKLFRLDGAPQLAGSYESPVHDAGNIARWGRLDWLGETNQGEFVFKTRSGNSARPDRTWSEWAPPAQGETISSPNARYIQWQVELKAKQGRPAPLLDSVGITYQPQNTRPAVRSISVTPQWTALPGKTVAGAPATAAYSITVTDSGDAAAATSAGTPTQAVERSGHPQIVISWQADDPDSDKLVYGVYFRGEDERVWKPLKENLTENTLLQDAEVFADGRYFFRVVASDRLSNAPSAARESELVSPPVLIDQTPPRVTLSAPIRSGQDTEIVVAAVDAASPLRRAEYSLDASSWKLLDADDGITDSRAEKFTLKLRGLSTGEHTVVVRVLDAAGNPGLAKTVLR